MSTPALRTITLKDGTVHVLRFTTYAAYLVQKETGLTLDNILSRIVTGTAGVMELTALLWGGLEGHRRKARIMPPTGPWTLENVSNLVDDHGDMVEFFTRTGPAITQSFLDSMPSMKKGETGTPTADAPVDPPAAASTGTDT